ncbi:MAG: T9SS type A sorting domain-containing protein [Lewinellaceae bacterium]|nr:T9SS type A sorting domain-containing protein [Lewinellaceae bacterium]
MKKQIFLIVLLFVVANLPAQQGWYKRYSGDVFNSFTQLLPADAGYLFLNYNNVFKVDKGGSERGRASLSLGLSEYIGYMREFPMPATGFPAFVVARRTGYPGQASYLFSEFIPGEGFKHDLLLHDTHSSLSRRSPMVIPVNDSTDMVFGKDSIWQLLHLPGIGFQITGQQPWGGMPQAVCATGFGYCLAHDAGGNMSAGISGIDPAGNTIWSVANPFSRVSNLSTSGSAIMGCGNLNNTGAIFKMASGGILEWTQTYADVQNLFDLKATLDGGIIAAGQTQSSLSIVLLRCDADGNELWRREFEKGAGVTVFSLNDGGFLLAARASTGNFRNCLIRTDADGMSAAPQDIRADGVILETDSLRVEFKASSNLFTDFYDANFQQSPDGKPAVQFASSPWLGGYDASGALRLAADDYIMRDFRSGSANTKEKDFSRVWAVSRSGIDAFRTAFALNEIQDYNIPVDILQWPGKGNPNLRVNPDFTPVTTEPSLFPAPFVDNNNDGLYNAYDGDYPAMKGDRMVWWAITDSTQHLNTMAAPIVADFFISAFTFDCPANLPLENSVWVDFQVIKRTPGALDSTYLGLFTDFDLGCYQDDHIGTAEQADAVYVYNQDAEDQDCLTALGFHNDIPILSAGFVNQNLSNSIFFEASGDGPFNMSEPNTPIEYYYYLSGRRKNGDSIATAPYIFPDNPADPNGVSMCTANMVYADRRMVYAHGPFSLETADTFLLQTVFTLHHGIEYPCPNIELSVIPDAQAIRSFRNDGTLDDYSTQDPVVYLPAGETTTLSPGVDNAIYGWSDGSSGAEFAVVAPGTYTVTITNAAVCSREYTFQVRQAVGTAQQHTLLADWNMQPNPVADISRFICSDCPPGALQLKVFNAQGVPVLEKKLQNNDYLSFRELPAGVYALSLWQNGQWLGSKKLIKLKN